MRYHLGLGGGHAHLSTSSYRSMSIDAQDEPVPESLPIGRDVRTRDDAVADDDDDNDESDYSEMGLEDCEGLDDVERDNSSNGGNNYDQDSDDYDDSLTIVANIYALSSSSLSISGTVLYTATCNISLLL